MNALLLDNLQGIRQIKAFGRQGHEDDRFARRADDLRRGTLVVMSAWATYGPAMQFIGALGIGLVLWIGGSQVIQGRMGSASSWLLCSTRGSFSMSPSGGFTG